MTLVPSQISRNHRLPLLLIDGDLAAQLLDGGNRLRLVAGSCSAAHVEVAKTSNDNASIGSAIRLTALSFRGTVWKQAHSHSIAAAVAVVANNK